MLKNQAKKSPAKSKHEASVDQVSAILKKLMYASGISEAELSRQTKLPQATINRILLGGTSDPRASTLNSIAKFFDISIEELIGNIPIQNKQATYNPSLESARAIPIIPWKDVPHWEALSNTLTANNHKEWIVIDKESDAYCFAVTSTPSMEPRFPSGSTLILDTEREYRDGGYVVVLLDKKHPAIRRIYRKGKAIYLKSLDESGPIYAANTADIIVGTITETRINMD